MSALIDRRPVRVVMAWGVVLLFIGGGAALGAVISGWSLWSARVLLVPAGVLLASWILNRPIALIPESPVADELWRSLERIDESLRGSGALLWERPMLLVLGPAGSTKSSILGSDSVGGHRVTAPGDDTAEGGVVAAWTIRGLVALELRGLVLDDTSALELLGDWLEALAGRGVQPPRGVVLTIDIPSLVGATPDACVESGISSAVQILRLGTIVRALPVHVLFTKADTVEHFADFAGGLAEDVVHDRIGVDELFPDASGYADLGRELHRGFSELRTAVLPHVDGLSARRAAFEFPRQVRRLQSKIESFLIGLREGLDGRTSLDGLSLTGVRPVEVRRGERADDDGSPSATDFFVSEAPGSVRSAEPSSVERLPQWVFLRELFRKRLPEMLERAGPLVPEGRWKRWIPASTAIVAVVLTVGAAMSFIANRALVRSATDALAGVQAELTAPGARAALEALARLKAPVTRLAEYERAGPPPHMGLGFFSPESARNARTGYVRAFNRILGDSLRTLVERRIIESGSSGMPHARFEATRAYLVLTQFPDSIDDRTTAFLAEVWQSGNEDATDTLALQQVEFLADVGGVQSIHPSDLAILATARTGFRDAELTAEVERAIHRAIPPDLSPLRFEQAFPAEDPILVVVDEVPARYTRAAWPFIEGGLRDPLAAYARSVWVTGGEAFPQARLAQTQRELMSRHEAAAATAWRDFVASAVWSLAGTGDADRLTGPGSPLVRLAWLVESNVGTVAPERLPEFESLGHLLSPNRSEPRPSGDARRYLLALDELAEAREESAGADVFDAAVESAADALATLTSRFPRAGRAGEVAALVHRILEVPLEALSAR